MSLTCPHCHQPFTLVAAAAATQPAGAATSSAPAGTSWLCPIHRQVKTVPAGVSQRTGKTYSAFLACPVAGCDQKPPRGLPAAVAAQPAPAAVPAPPAANEPPLPPPPSDLEELPF